MPFRRPSIVVSLAAAAFALATVAAPAHALRVATWNIARYDGSQTSLEPSMRTVINGMNPDVIVLEELDSATGRDRFLNNVLNTAQPGQWSATSWVQLQSFPVEGGAIFYKTAAVTVSGLTTISTSGPRDVPTCFIQPTAYVSPAAGFQMFSVHLKAGGPGTADSTTRRLECTDIRNYLNGLAPGTNFMLGGDTNFYGDQEGGYARLIESQLNNNGRLKDPNGLSGTWHQNSSYVQWFTQSPCLSGDCPSGFTGGGLDDRFDIWFTSYGMEDGVALDYAPGGAINSSVYPWAYGNDNQHYKIAVNSAPTNSTVGQTIADALHASSDHLPVLIVLALPPKIVGDSELDLATIIVGGISAGTFQVANGAVQPASALHYSLTAPAGFVTQNGSFTRNAGALPNNHSAHVDASSPGFKSGALYVNSDDPDSSAKPVQLSCTVLRHASASLDSASVLVTTPLDFGQHVVGQFSDMPVRVFDQGWDALEAGLSVDSGTLTGDSRFSIVGGFNPTLIGGIGQTWSIHFDDTNATAQTYTATLTFATSDEPYDGGTSQASLTVNISATVTSDVAGVKGRTIPKVLAFYPPRPNPVATNVEIAFDLPHAAPASLAVFDLAGRRIATLASGTLEADHYAIAWDGRGDGGGRVAPGLYFVRFVTPGMHRTTRLVMLP